MYSGPVYRLQFIGLGRVGWGEEKLVMLEGKCYSCVFVFPYTCLAKGNLITPVMGLGFPGLALVSPALCCAVVAGRSHVGCPGGSGSSNTLKFLPMVALAPAPQALPSSPKDHYLSL